MRIHNNYFLQQYLRRYTTYCKHEQHKKYFLINVQREIIKSGQYTIPCNKENIRWRMDKWEQKDFDNGILLSFRPFEMLDNKLAHIVDWFNSTGMENSDPRGIQTIDKAYELANKWFKKQNKKLVAVNDSEHIKVILEFKDGFKIVKMLTPEALKYESLHMNHCIGHGSYDKLLKSGGSEFVSLRDSNNNPHCTIEINVHENTIYQIKGKNNNIVIKKYRKYIKKFLNISRFDDILDLTNIGMVFFNKKIYSTSQLYKLRDLVIEGDVYLSDMGLTKLPHFKSISGDFDCSNNKLTTLKGCPTIVGGDFDCSSNRLTSLEYGPTIVGGNFICYSNKLTTLEGSPTTVGGDFRCAINRLTTLKGCPTTVGGNFDIDCNKLTKLEGCPTIVGGNFDCSNNRLTTLVGCPTIVDGDFSCYYNKLTTLEGCPTTVSGRFSCSDNLLTSLENGPTTVGGEYSCTSNQLISLNGSPRVINHDFNCSVNLLTSLEGSPSKINGDFNCSDNLLTSLEKSPTIVGGDFDCSSNRLTTLEGRPKTICGYFNHYYNMINFEQYETV